MKGMLNFCDLMCTYAEIPRETAVDGSGSCRTFIALHCNLKKTLVHKNMPCSQKILRKEDKETAVRIKKSEVKNKG
ncbi:MAG: hypothetical protein NTU90_03320 [Proteobacteria bacterium]|nr:hypothetical protein [Pseudomonadota bacterium]